MSIDILLSGWRRMVWCWYLNLWASPNHIFLRRDVRRVRLWYRLKNLDCHFVQTYVCMTCYDAAQGLREGEGELNGGWVGALTRLHVYECTYLLTWTNRRTNDVTKYCSCISILLNVLWNYPVMLFYFKKKYILCIFCSRTIIYYMCLVKPCLFPIEMFKICYFTPYIMSISNYFTPFDDAHRQSLWYNLLPFLQQNFRLLDRCVLSYVIKTMSNAYGVLHLLLNRWSITDAFQFISFRHIWCVYWRIQMYLKSI